MYRSWFRATVDGGRDDEETDSEVWKRRKDEFFFFLDKLKDEFHRPDSDRIARDGRVWPLALFHTKACGELPDFFRQSSPATWQVPAMNFMLLIFFLII